jgi:hypothetical protein
MLRKAVRNRFFAMLLPVGNNGVSTQHSSGWRRNARKLIHPLLQDLDNQLDAFEGGEPTASTPDPYYTEWFLKLCFLLLENDPDTEREDEARSRSVATLLRAIYLYEGTVYWSEQRFIWHTQLEFDRLVDYHTRLCKGTDFTTIGRTFTVLAKLGRSPSDQDRQRLYIGTIIQFMGHERIHLAYSCALRAAGAIPEVIALVGREDVSLQERFLKALTSAVFFGRLQVGTPFNANAFREVTHIPLVCQHYLELVQALSHEQAWLPRLHENEQFDICLQIADTLSSQNNGDLNKCVVCVTRILAVVDTWGIEHPFFNTVEKYPLGTLILRAWKIIFSFVFQDEESTEWRLGVSSGTGYTDYLEALPSLVDCEKRRGYDRGGKTGDLIILLKQVCVEQKQCGALFYPMSKAIPLAI